MRITLVRAWPRRFDSVEVDVEEGATVANALARAGWAADAVAIHGVRAAPHEVLRDGDRVEVLRPLLVDPKQARRQRAANRPLR